MTDSTPAATGSRTAGSTTRGQFDALIDAHRVIPVIRELFADGETPVGIYRKLANGLPGSFLLESAEQGGIWSRFSFVGVSSFGVLTQEGEPPRWVDNLRNPDRPHCSPAALRPHPARGYMLDTWHTPP
ncbi:MAG: anthranilate synthase component I, partial [Cryobacterium sp.]|nr:anthranilate synthase component I [Cryobacterium sp.]